MIEQVLEMDFRCPKCGTANQKEDLVFDSLIVCNSCGSDFGKVGSFAGDPGGIRNCGICGCRDLYIQKDFSRKVGCAIALIGAALAPFTKLISLFVCALIDLILYKVLPVITICYRCKGIYRGFPNNSDHEGFNLGINDRYRAMEEAHQR
jgi:hypothetical protein